MQPFITLEIPPADFGNLATAAALEGLDLTRWVKRKIKNAAADGTLARMINTCHAADAATAAPAAICCPDSTPAGTPCPDAV